MAVGAIITTCCGGFGAGFPTQYTPQQPIWNGTSSSHGRAQRPSRQQHWSPHLMHVLGITHTFSYWHRQQMRQTQLSRLPQQPSVCRSFLLSHAKHCGEELQRAKCSVWRPHLFPALQHRHSPPLWQPMQSGNLRKMERLEQQHAQHMDKYSGSGNEMKGLGFSAAGAATITAGCSTGWTCMMLVAVLFNRLIRMSVRVSASRAACKKKKSGNAQLLEIMGY